MSKDAPGSPPTADMKPLPGADDSYRTGPGTSSALGRWFPSAVFYRRMIAAVCSVIALW